MPPAKVYKCGSCNENIGKTQASIQCCNCLLWLHAACCGFSDRDLAVLKANKQFNYSCTTCSTSPRTGVDCSIRNDITALTNVINNFIKRIESEQTSVKNVLSNLDKKIDTFIARVDNEQSSIKQLLADSVSSIKTDMASCIRELKNDIIDCNKLINHVDEFTVSKISALEDENFVLHKRLNRADIVINGLPIGIGNLCDPVIKLASHYNISITSIDLHHVCYINKRKSVLVKFNSVFVRDSIMSAYFKTRTLKVKDVIEEDIDLRVYLNDHYSPAAGKLNGICRKLLKKKIINKFKMWNGDTLKVKLTMPDGKEVIFNTTQCTSLLSSS